MIYAVSDIHGCYRQYKEVLEKIRFSDEDTLYVLGDVLVHADLAGDRKDRPLEEYGLEQMLFSRAEYDRKYSDSYYLVTGHTSNFRMGSKYDGKIYKKNHHIAIDCGCVSGRRLGVYCFDTGECFYSSDY